MTFPDDTAGTSTTSLVIGTERARRATPATAHESKQTTMKSVLRVEDRVAQ